MTDKPTTSLSDRIDQATNTLRHFVHNERAFPATRNMLTVSDMNVLDLASLILDRVQEDKARKRMNELNTDFRSDLEREDRRYVHMDGKP